MDFLQSLKTCGRITVQTDYPVGSFTGYGVGGCAKYFVKTQSFNQLRTVLEFAQAFAVPVKILGNGTNILFSDKGYNGVVVSTKDLNGIKIKNGAVICASGVTLKKLAEFSVKNGFSGLEALSGIPATVGGAVVMNAGAYGCSISDYIVTVDLLRQGKLVRLNKNDCKFRYRGSKLLDDAEVVLSAEFKLPVCDYKNKCKELARRFSVLRELNQPKGKSCGSVFKNPKNRKAGWLIERSGLKGVSVGGASVSDKHCNFIVTERGATATDVYKLIKLIKTKVKNKFNIELQEEIEYVGEF